MSEESVKLRTKFENKRAAVYAKRDELAAEEPEFWKTAFGNFAGLRLSGLLSEADGAAIESLKEVHVERDPTDYKIITVRFTFAEADSRPFKNSVLVKKVTIDEEGEGTVHQKTILEPREPVNSKAGSKRSKDEAADGCIFFVFFEDDQTLTSEMLAEFYADAHKYYLGDIEDIEGLFFEGDSGEEDDEPIDLDAGGEEDDDEDEEEEEEDEE